MNLTKLALKRPVSVILIMVALAVFGISFVFNFKMELQPDVEMPILMVTTTYPGADRETIEKGVTKQIEEAGAVLSGIDSYSSVISENYTVTMFSYEYDTNIDDAYTDLRVVLDKVKNDLPEGAKEPYIMEMSLENSDIVTVSANTVGDTDLLKYVNESLVPELESVLGVAKVDVYGGKEKYVKVELKEKAMLQYGLDMTTIGKCIASVNYTIPAGEVEQGTQDVPILASSSVENIEDLKKIPITTSSGSVISLGEVANIELSTKKAETLSRYDGNENVTIGVKKKQSYGTVNIAKNVKEKVEELNEKNEAVELNMIYDASDTIVSSLTNVLYSLLLGIVVSMIVLYLFFGDIKASLIVGSSMPISILTTIILMYLMGFSLNVVTTSALVIATGMIVDNAIVVLESCFIEKQKRGNGKKGYKAAAYKGTKIITSSVIASTLTTVVVYLPLSVMKGLSGQLFSQLGMTIIFAMLSSLISAITIVPLFFYKLKPIEKKDCKINKIIEKILVVYEKMLKKILYHKKRAVAIALILLAITGVLVYISNVELMPQTDEHMLSISTEFRAGTTLESMDKEIENVEKMIKENEAITHYLLTVNENTVEITAYLDKNKETLDVMDNINKQLSNIPNIDVTVQSVSNNTMMSSSNGIEVDLRGNDLETLRSSLSEIEEKMLKTEGVIKVDNDFSKSKSRTKISINELKAMNSGCTSVQVATELKNAISGLNATKISCNGDEYDIVLEYADEKYKDINDVLNLPIQTKLGNTIILSDIAEIKNDNSIEYVNKTNGKYQVAVKAYTNQKDRFKVEKAIKQYQKEIELPEGVKFADTRINKIIDDEFVSILLGILVAIFLVFLVMAMQFESPRFSMMVMMSIPFGCIGSFGMLFLSGSTVSLVSLMGNLMLVGIVVNDGILYVDTVNMLRKDMKLEEALIESGKMRFRPIMMTTLTTVLSMIPMLFSSDTNSRMLQSMAYVIIGGLSTATFIILILMPTFYLIIDKNKDKDGEYFENVKEVVENDISFFEEK